MSRHPAAGSSGAPGLLIEVRQGGRLVAALPLASEPIELTLRDIRSGLPMGTLVARGPTLGGVDEQPVPKLTRPPEDDLTLPLPERSETISAKHSAKHSAVAAPKRELTGDLDHTDPETETAEASIEELGELSKLIPNLADTRRTPDTRRTFDNDDATSPSIKTVARRQADEEPSRTRPRPTAVSGLPMGRSGPPSGYVDDVSTADLVEDTLGAHLMDAREDTVGSMLVEATRAQLKSEETLGAHLVDAAPARSKRHVPPAPAGSRKPPARRLSSVPPAEVWTRNASEWRTAGRLLQGQRTTVQQGWVELDDSGRLVVYAGPEMSGTATLVNGRTVEITRNSQRVRLPPGSSVILRGSGHGLYVRADPPSPGR